VVSGSKGASGRPKVPTGPLRPAKAYKKEAMYAKRANRSLTDEEELKGLEEERQAALEVAQEEDEETEEGSEAQEEVRLR
jgi:hypothetical protein